MKKIYLFVTAISFAATGVAQLVTYPTKTLKTQYDLASPEQLNTIANRPSTMQERAAGDVIWETSFDYSANWQTTVTSGAANATHNWIIGSATTWFFPGITSTSGAPYATCLNGDPSGGTHYPGGSFILELDSVFDLSAITNNILVEFEQYGGRYNDSQFFEISTDGGTIWTPVYSNEKIPGMFWGAGQPYNDPHFIQFDITNAIAGNPSNVRIRFHLTWDSAITSPGVTYGWYIDDIKMREAYDYDVALVDPYISVGQWPSVVTQLPTMQLTDITFSATVRNNGNMALTGVDFAANCAAAGFSGTSGGSALAAGAGDSLVVSTVFPAPSTTGNKVLTYSVDATESLSNTYDDAATETIKITSNIMAADWYDGTDESITSTFWGWAAPSGGTATIGNIMEVYEDGGISGVRVGVRDYSGTTNSEGNTLVVEIWKYDGTDLVFEYSYEDYIVDASDIGTLAEVMFDEPLEVFAGDILYVGAGWYDGADVPVMMSGESPIGTVFGTDGSTLYTLSDPDPTETNIGSPVVRAIFIDNIGVEEIAKNDFTVGQNIPNPFAANSTINYTLTEAAYVTVSFTDITGKVVKTMTPGNLTAGTYSLNVDGSDMAEGVYFYTFTVGDNKITKQMVVSKN